MRKNPEFRKERPSSEEARADSRPKRIPVSGQRDILTVPNMDPAYVYRWVNDEPGRIAKFLEASYEFVPVEGQVGDATVDSSHSIESAVSKTVKRTGGQAYLMRIRKEYYDEDFLAKMQKIDDGEKALFHKLQNDEGRYGHINVDRGNK